MLAFNDCSEKRVVFQLFLVFYIRIVSCGSENKEIVAGLLVKIHICEPGRVLAGAVVGRSMKPSCFPVLRNLQVAVKRWLVRMNVLPGNEAKLLINSENLFP